MSFLSIEPGAVFYFLFSQPPRATHITFFDILSTVPWLPSSGEFLFNLHFCLCTHVSPGIGLMGNMLIEEIRKLKGDVCNHTARGEVSF